MKTLGTIFKAIGRIVAKVLDRLFRSAGYRWVPLTALLADVVALGLGLWIASEKKWLPPADDATFLTIGAGLIWLAALGGFAGSYVRILRNVVDGDYKEMSPCTSILVPMMRPLAGVGVGLFLLAVYASGTLAMPIGDPDDSALGDIDKAEAFVFAIAFVGGLFDEFVIKTANRLMGRIDKEGDGPRASEGPRKQEPAKDDEQAKDDNATKP